MKRASLQGRLVVAALTAALLSSVVPAAGLSVSGQDSERTRDTALINLARPVPEVKVTAGPAGVLIEWQSAFQLDSLGFNIYRDQGGNRTQVNPSIIAAAHLAGGRQNQWFDPAGDRNARYYLEQID